MACTEGQLQAPTVKIVSQQKQGCRVSDQVLHARSRLVESYTSLWCVSCGVTIASCCTCSGVACRVQSTEHCVGDKLPPPATVRINS